VESLDWDWNIQVGSHLLDDSSNLIETRIRNIQAELNLDHLEPTDAIAPTQRNETSRRHFDFLLNFTRGSGLRAIFNYNRQRCRSALEIFQTPRMCDVNSDNLDTVSNNTSRSVFIDSQLLKKNQEPFRVGLVNFIECLDDPLFAQTKAIWDSFSPSRIRSSQNILLSAEDSRFSDERCLQFFSPPSLKRLIQIFWDEWYPHCPIIHKPTFDILRAPPILLVPMAVMGACLSPISQELKSAKE
jgi:hypothetical protein